MFLFLFFFLLYCFLSLSTMGGTPCAAEIVIMICSYVQPKGDSFLFLFLFLYQTMYDTIGIWF